MMESSRSKKDMFYLIVLLLTLITVIVGATLALYKLIATQNEDETVLYTGTLEVNYIDGVYLKDPELYPITNVDYNTTEKVYRNTFAITSTGSLDQLISISLIIELNEFKENYLKYAFYNSLGEEMQRGYVPQTGEINLANNLYLESNKSAKYTLIVWLDENGINQNEEFGKIIRGRIKTDAVQTKY